MKNQFAKRLTELLKEKDLSKRALAQKIGLSAMSISDWTTGKVQPTAENIFIIASFFNVTSDYLLGREDEFGNITISSGNVSGNNNTVNSHNVIHPKNSFSEQLSADERELITLWKKLPPDKRKAFINLLK